MAVCLAANVCLAVPAAAEDAGFTKPEKTGSVMENLLEVPILGDLLKLFVPDKNSGAFTEGTTDTASTPERAATAETATKETASTPESATPAPSPTQNPGEGATDGLLTGAPVWPAAWMLGSAAKTFSYPAGSKDAGSATATATLWGAPVMLSGATLRVNNREETNLGDLTADAVAHALASNPIYHDSADLENLPIVALVDGASFNGENIEAGAVIDEAAAGKALADQAISVVIVTPKKLAEVLSAGLKDMLDAAGANYGGFLQVSGIRFTYEITNGAAGVKTLALADTAGEISLSLTDDTTRLALALPSDLLAVYALSGAAGYADYLQVSSALPITLRGALTALPQNADAATLAAMLARAGSMGRILPASAANYRGMVILDAGYAGKTIRCLLDGQSVSGVVDSVGCLYFDNLTPGFHTVRMKAGEPAYYISSITGVGTSNGAAVTVPSVPADCVDGAAPTAQPVPTAAPAPTALPVNNNGGESGTDSANSADSTTTTAVATAAPAAPAAAAPQATAKKAAGGSGGGTTAKATAAPVEDPSADKIIATPAPTIAPTPSPSPTPAPTADPDELQKLKDAEKQSSRLPLYIGLAALLGCGGVLAGVLIKRRLEEDKKNNRKNRNNGSRR